MSRLTRQYGQDRLATVRASRVDYFHQHDYDSWLDQLGSLGMGGSDAVFINLAGIAGPINGRPQAMQAINYRAPMAAARACEQLGFGHFIQSSTQATKAERAGQVPYSRWKAMCDYALSRLGGLPVSVFVVGMLYCKEQGVVGQRGDNLNMVDLTLLPFTPIMGNGKAPLQPLEVCDAAQRIAFMALTEPTERPVQPLDPSWSKDAWARPKTSASRAYTLRTYDAVGPETMSLLELMQRFARVNGRELKPVFVDYRNFEMVLNVASLGNLNRQFVSLLRSEQDAERPIVGNPAVFERLLGDGARLARLEDGAGAAPGEVEEGARPARRSFPISKTALWVAKNPGVIIPGAHLVLEAVGTYYIGTSFAQHESWRIIRNTLLPSILLSLGVASMYAGSVMGSLVSYLPPAFPGGGT